MKYLQFALGLVLASGLAASTRAQEPTGADYVVYENSGYYYNGHYSNQYGGGYHGGGDYGGGYGGACSSCGNGYGYGTPGCCERSTRYSAYDNIWDGYCNENHHWGHYFDGLLGGRGCGRGHGCGRVWTPTCQSHHGWQSACHGECNQGCAPSYSGHEAADALSPPAVEPPMPATPDAGVDAAPVPPAPVEDAI